MIVNLEEAITLLKTSNKSFLSLKISDKDFGPAGALALAEAIQANNTITNLKLELTDYKIRNEGASAFAKAIQKNKTIINLNLRLRYCRIEDEGILALAKAIQVNKTITNLNLDLASNDVGKKSGLALATALQENKTIMNLSLCLLCCQINDKDASALAKAIEQNINITSLNLNLTSYYMGTIGVLELAKAIQKNKTIVNLNLNLSYNRIGYQGALALAESIRKNTTITNLNLIPFKIKGIDFLIIAKEVTQRNIANKKLKLAVDILKADLSKDDIFKDINSRVKECSSYELANKNDRFNISINILKDLINDEHVPMETKNNAMFELVHICNNLINCINEHIHEEKVSKDTIEAKSQLLDYFYQYSFKLLEQKMISSNFIKQQLFVEFKLIENAKKIDISDCWYKSDSVDAPLVEYLFWLSKRYYNNNTQEAMEQKKCFENVSNNICGFYQVTQKKYNVELAEKNSKKTGGNRLQYVVNALEEQSVEKYDKTESKQKVIKATNNTESELLELKTESDEKSSTKRTSNKPVMLINNLHQENGKTNVSNKRKLKEIETAQFLNTLNLIDKRDNEVEVSRKKRKTCTIL